MKLFRSKRAKTATQKQMFDFSTELNLKTTYVEIDGHKIKPVFNKNVKKLVAENIMSLPKKPTDKDCKYMCIHHSNYVVYFAIAEAAKQQCIPFDYNVTDLFYKIDFQDYVHVLVAIQKSVGMQPNSPVFN